MKAALYLRLSKEDVEKEQFEFSQSIKNQQSLLEQYASNHAMEIYKIYMDDDYSGLSMERPDFLSMLSDAANQKFEVVLAKSQSRLSRNQVHIDYLLHDFFPSCGITFIGVSDGINSSEIRNKKVHQINALINEWYSEDLSQSIKTVLKSKMKKGEYIGSYPPYGYRKGDKNRHVLVIFEEEANWVRKMFEWYLKGYSMKQIAMLLDDKRVPTPFGKSKCWSTSTIQKILSNEVYLGVLQQGKYKKKSFKSNVMLPVKREYWICVEHTHAPIVEKDIFEKVKALRESKCKRKYT